MLKKVFFLSFLLCLTLFFKVQATLVGNPSSPGIYTNGLISKNQIIYLRGGYFYENIYYGEYKPDVLKEDPSCDILKLRSFGGSVSINIKNRWDIYTLLGVSDMNLCNQIYTKNNFCWCVGTKLILYKYKDFYLGIDGKYFRTSHEANKFILDKLALPVIFPPDFGYTIQSYQGFCGLSYKICMFIPYAGVTYLYSTINPSIKMGLFLLPPYGKDDVSEFDTNSSINSKKWGFAGGVTIISNDMVSVNIETRLIDQYATDVELQIRF